MDIETPAAPAALPEVTTETSTTSTGSTSTEKVTPDAGTTPKEIKPDAQTGERMFKVKVDGQEVEVPESELLRGYGHMKAANSKLQEASMMKKQAESFIEQLRVNPMKVLKNPNLGVDVRKFAEEFLLQQYQDEIDPKSAENRKLKEQLAEIESEKTAKEEAARHEELERDTKHWMDEYVREIDEAVANSPSLPKNDPEVQKRFAYYLQQGMSPEYIARNGRPAKAADVAGLVEQDFKNWTKSLYGNLTPEQLLEYFGEDIAKKIRQQDIKRLKNPIPESKGKPAFKKPAPVKKQTTTDFFEQLRQRDKEKQV